MSGSLLDDRFAQLWKDVCDFPDGEISVPSSEIRDLFELAKNAYDAGYRDAVDLYTSPRRA